MKNNKTKFCWYLYPPPPHVRKLKPESSVVCACLCSLKWGHVQQNHCFRHFVPVMLPADETSRGRLVLERRGSHLFGVIVEDTDGAQLWRNTATLCVGCTTVFVWSLFELVCNGNISDWRWPCLYNDFREKSRVQNKPNQCHDQTYKENHYQDEYDKIRHCLARQCCRR